MTAQAITLPVGRGALHIPRRDLVIAASDSLALRVSVVEADNPAAATLVLTGGVGGPALALLIYRDDPRPSGRFDYAGPTVPPGTVLLAVPGVIALDAPGAFDITLEAGALIGLPRRSAFALRLDWNGGVSSELLAAGYLHITPIEGVAMPTAEAITTDALAPITTD